MTLPKGRWTRADMSLRYRLFRALVRVLCTVFLGYVGHGEEKVPAEGPLIVAANHHRFFDPVFVSMSVPRRVRWMGKKELFAFPFRWFFYFIGAYPVDRGAGGRSALRTSLTFLAEGRTLGIFPEGTRQRGGVTAGEAKSGTVMLAVRSGAPVLPVFVDRIPGPAARLRGERFHAYVGDPITLDDKLRGGRAYREAAEEILRTIYSLPERHKKAAR